MRMPDDFDQLTALSSAGWIGWVTAVVVGGILAFRRIWHNDKVFGASASSTVDTIQRLYDLLDRERANASRLQELLAEANERADQANRERNEVVRELGEIKAQLAELQAEVRMLRRETGREQ